MPRIDMNDVKDNVHVHVDVDDETNEAKLTIVCDLDVLPWYLTLFAKNLLQGLEDRGDLL